MSVLNLTPKKLGLFSCTAMIIFSSLMPLSVMAFDKKFFSQNDADYYNPDETCASTSSEAAGSDTVTDPDKLFGTGPVTPGAGHNWKPGVATDFGGPSENQGMSYGGSKTTVDYDNANVFYYAILPKDYGNLKMNPNTPKEIQDAVKSGKLKPKGKLLVKKGSKTAIAVWLDVGPGASGDGRWIDFGQKLSKYLSLGGVGKIEWDFPGTGDTVNASSAGTATTANKTDIKLEKTTTLQQIYSGLTAGGLNAVQASAVMGNMYAESGFKSDAVEAGNGNGYGLAQWSSGRKASLFAFADKKGVAHSDVAMQIEFLLQEYNQTYKAALGTKGHKDFLAGTDVAKSAKDWMEVFESPASVPTNNPAALNTKRIPAAAKIYELYGGGTATSSTCGSSSTGNGVVAGSIVQTTLNLALAKPASNGMSSESDAKPAYIEAVKKYNPPLSGKVADCGAFVGTVMKASGADKDYPGIGTSVQLEYVNSHSSKYKVIKNPKKSDLQPGDILIVHYGSNHHTQIYTGGSPYPLADASLGDRVPSVRTDGSLSYMLGLSGVVAARLIK